jgi:hypothetical protein
VFDEQLLGDRQQAFPGGRPALEVAVHVRLPSSTGRPSPPLAAVPAGRAARRCGSGPAEHDIARTLDTRPTVGMED